ncbi:MAG: 3'-5' exonuclease [bacterium]|nr:3'-5' exonuclease [bacterium]
MDIKVDAAKTSMRSRPLIFLDLESTGLNVQEHEILEIGALKTNPRPPFRVLGELEIKVKPENLEKADKDALKIAGFSSEGWKDALPLKEALLLLDKFAQDGVLVGFNVTYDWAMLDRAYFSQGRCDPFYYHRLDVMSMAYFKLFKKRTIARFSLGNIVKFLKVERGTKHRALEDARATYLAFRALFALK